MWVVDQFAGKYNCEKEFLPFSIKPLYIEYHECDNNEYYYILNKKTYA